MILADMGSTMRIFCYGTLMLPPVLKTVLGRRLPAVDAVLEDHAARCLHGAWFPGLRPQRGARTAGRLYEGVTPGDLRRLDRYEGDLYRRRRVRVHVTDERQVTAWCYVVHSRYLHRLTDRPWSARRFGEQHLAAWLSGL
jgi:gamma-glutamylcyclotransferase (GGCT)/AIG2-like uncharacterized protein YtfP